MFRLSQTRGRYISRNRIPSALYSHVRDHLQNKQPAQSFKNRGIALFIHRALLTHGPQAHFVIASSGSAGMAAAYTAKRLGARCTVCLPKGTMLAVVEKLKGEGAEVIEQGKVYIEALEQAKAIIEGDPHG